MKITTEQLKQIVKEELEATLQEQQPLDEGLMDFINSIFNRNDPFEGDYGDFKEDVQYKQGTYGHFVQSSGIVSTMAKENVNLERNTIKAAAETVIGAGGGKTGSIIAVGLALVGVLGPAAVGAILGFVGVGAAINSLYNSFKKNPSMVEKYPSLSVFALDPKWEEILDNDLEKKILKSYQEFFIEKVRTVPQKKMIPLDRYVRGILRKSKDGRTLTRPGLPATGWKSE